MTSEAGPAYRALFEPYTLRGLTLRNRIISTPHGPAYAEDGMPGERYQRYHEEKARGGIAMTIKMAHPNSQHIGAEHPKGPRVAKGKGRAGFVTHLQRVR